MLDQLRLGEIRRIVQADWVDVGAERVTEVATDSRHLRPGALYVALRGASFDGHAFVPRALAAGAVAAVVERSYRASDLPPERLVRVDAPLAAYQALARWQRRRVARPVVAITGSVGKTSTKELVVAALGSASTVLATPGNTNNEIGVPRALLGLRPAHRFAVLEMGMRGPGQIRELGAIAEPDVAVITNVGTAHIGLLGSRAAIARAKCELLETLPPDGLAILNADCPLLVETARRIWHGRILTFGLEQGDWRGELLPDGRLQVEDEVVQPPLAGRHQALNLLAALAVGRHFGIAWAALRRLQVRLPGGRGRRLALPDAVVLIDDTYNAGPESTVAALRLLAAEPARRRLAVLGTMKELGPHSLPLHEEVGRAVADLGVDELLIYADPAEAAALARGAAAVPSRSFANAGELARTLAEHLQPGDCVLFKASRAVALDRVVAMLVAARTARPVRPDPPP